MEPSKGGTESDNAGTSSVSSEHSTPVAAPRLQSLVATVTKQPAGRRSFTPNLSVAGKRLSSGSNSPADAPATKKRKRDGRKEQKGKEPKKERPKKEIIATHGVFSKGVRFSDVNAAAQAARDKSFGSRFSVNAGMKKEPRSTPKADVVKSIPSAPVSSLNAFADADVTEDAIKTQLAQTFLSDIPEAEMNPTVLPLTSFDPGPSSQSAPGTELACSPLLDSKESDDFLFFQLPTFIPDLFSQNDQASTSRTDGPNGSHTEMGYSTMPSGHIGKLQRLRDGRVRLKLNNGTFIYLEEGMKSGFRQEVVHLSDEKLAVLGTVTKRFTAVPEID